MARIAICTTALLVVFVSLLIASSQAAIATVYASADASVYAANPSRANSLGSYLWVGSTGGEIRTLVKFTDFSAIPSGSVINSAQLRLVNTAFSYSGPASTIDAYIVNVDWAEGTTSTILEIDNGQTGADTSIGSGDPTWSHRTWNTATWTTAGGDASLTPVASYTLGTGESTVLSGSLTTTVSSWITSPVGNYGLLLRTTGAARRLGSRETIDSNKIALIIDYTPSGGSNPPPPPVSSGSTTPTRATSAPRNVIDFTKPAPGEQEGTTGTGGGLSAGAIAGIVCGVIAVLIAVIRIVLICILR